MINPRNIKGFALAVALFMLVLLTLIGITAMKLTATHSRIVGNLQDSTEKDMAARAAIETYVTDHPILDCDAEVITFCIQQRAVCIEVSTSCIDKSISNPGSGSISGGKPLFNSYWDIRARAIPVTPDVDDSEPDESEPWVHQGLMIPLSGYCPQCQPQDVTCPTITCP